MKITLDVRKTLKQITLDVRKILKQKLTPSDKQIDKIVNDTTCRKCGYISYMSALTRNQIMCDHDFPMMDEPKPDIMLVLKSETKSRETDK